MTPQSPRMGHYRGTILACVAMGNGIAIAGDSMGSMNDTDNTRIIENKLIELEHGFVVGMSGIWKSDDGIIDLQKNIRESHRGGQTIEAFANQFELVSRASLAAFFAKLRLEDPSQFAEFTRYNAPVQSILAAMVKEGERATLLLELVLNLERGIINIDVKKIKKGKHDNNYVTVAGKGAQGLDPSEPRWRRAEALGRVPLATEIVRQAIRRHPASCGEPINCIDLTIPTGGRGVGKK